jgi:hypothetical protein
MIQKICFVATKSEERILKGVGIAYVVREMNGGKWKVVAEEMRGFDRLSSHLLLGFLKERINYLDRNDKAFFVGYNSHNLWREISNLFKELDDSATPIYLNHLFYYPPVDVMQSVLMYYIQNGLYPKNMRLGEVLESIHLKPERLKLDTLEGELLSVRKLAKIFGLMDTIE